MILISTGTSISGESSKSDSSKPSVLNNTRTSADNGSENKKQTNVVLNESSNETDLHGNHHQFNETFSPSMSSAGICTPLSIDNINCVTHKHVVTKRNTQFCTQNVINTIQKASNVQSSVWLINCDFHFSPLSLT